MDALKGSQERHFRNRVAFFFALLLLNISTMLFPSRPFHKHPVDVHFRYHHWEGILALPLWVYDGYFGIALVMMSEAVFAASSKLLYARCA